MKRTSILESIDNEMDYHVKDLTKQEYLKNGHVVHKMLISSDYREKDATKITTLTLDFVRNQILIPQGGE
jgi:hypothetical protein